MAVLTYSELKTLAFNRAQVNVVTDAPVTDAEFANFVNDAYADIWQISGGRIKTVNSATAWTNANLATGIVTGILPDIEEVRHVFASTTSGSTGTSAGDNELQPADLSEIQWLRKSSMTGTYDRPKLYAINGLATVTPASVNLKQLDYWPSVTGYYLPIIYVPQFTPIDGATVTTPDVNDLESRDIGLMTAMRIAPLVGRAELVPSIIADVSQRTQLSLARRFQAMLEGKQDDSKRAAA